MKRNKTLAYTLAAALLVGGTFLGTKALFQDFDTSENPLILTTGKVDIRVIADENWKRNVEDINKDGVISGLDDPLSFTGEEGTSFTNVQPGDTFTKYINVINQESTYGVDLTIKENINVIKPELKKYIKVVSGEKGTDSYGTQLKELDYVAPKSNTGGFVTIKILDKPGAWEALNGAGQIDLNAMYTITATQSEKTPSPLK